MPASLVSIDGDGGEQSPAASQFARTPIRSGASLRRLMVDHRPSRRRWLLHRISNEDAVTAIQRVWSAHCVCVPMTRLAQRDVDQARLFPNHGAGRQCEIAGVATVHGQGIGTQPRTSSPFATHEFYHIPLSRCRGEEGEDSRTIAGLFAREIATGEELAMATFVTVDSQRDRRDQKLMMA